MASKKRLICVFMIILVLCSIIRIGNIYILSFGDYSKKNIYAASYVGSIFTHSLDGVSGVGIHREYGDFVVDFNKDYAFEYINPGVWELFGALDIHNYGDSVSSLSFTVLDYYVNVFIENEKISFDYVGNSENSYACFRVKDGEIIPTDKRYVAALEEHYYVIDEIISKSEEIIDDYRNIMKVFCKRAIVFEVSVLIVCLLFIILLVKWYKEIMKKQAIVDLDKPENKKNNLKWGCMEALLYCFIIELTMIFFTCDGSVVGFWIYWVAFLIPIFIVAFVVILIVYYIQKSRINKNCNT